MAHATSPSPIADVTHSVQARLQVLRGKLVGFFFVEGLSRVLMWLLILIAADWLIDWFFHMDRAQRSVMLVLMGIALLYIVYRWLIRPMMFWVSDDALCLEVEAHHPELRERFISALQFSRMTDLDQRAVSPLLINATIEEGMRAAAELDFTGILRKDRFVTNVLLLAVMVLGLGGVAYAAANTESGSIWFERNVLLEERQWPQDTYFEIFGLVDGQLTIPRGDDWPMAVRIAEDSRVIPEEVSLEIRTAGTRRVEPLERQNDDLVFLTTLQNVIEEFEFRVRSDSAETPWYTAVLIDRPAVAELQLTVIPPEYTGGDAEPLPPGKGPYYVLSGSRLQVRGTATKTLSRAVLNVGESRREMQLSDETRFAVDLPPSELQAAVCRIELTDTAHVLQPGGDVPAPLNSKHHTQFSIKLRPDREPQIQARTNGISNLVVPQAAIPLQARIQDEFAVTAVRLDYRWRQHEADQADQSSALDLGALEAYRGLLPAADVALDYIFDLAPLEIPAGSVLNFQLQADDNDVITGPNTGQSTTFLLRVVTEDELRTDLLRREKEQRLELERLLKVQESLLTDTRATAAAVRDREEMAVEQRQELARQQKQQKLIGTNVATIADRLDGVIAEILNNRLEEPDGPLQDRLRRRIIAPLKTLSAQDVERAVDGLDRCRRTSGDDADRDAAFEETIAAQQQIIEKMQTILTHMIKAEGFQEAVNLLYELQKAQKQVFDLTSEERQKRLRQILEQGGEGSQPEKDSTPDEPEN